MNVMKHGENEWQAVKEEFGFAPQRRCRYLAYVWRSIKHSMARDLDEMNQRRQKIVTKNEWLIAAVRQLEQKHGLSRLNPANDELLPLSSRDEGQHASTYLNAAHFERPGYPPKRQYNRKAHKTPREHSSSRGEVKQARIDLRKFAPHLLRSEEELTSQRKQKSTLGMYQELLLAFQGGSSRGSSPLLIDHSPLSPFNSFNAPPQSRIVPRERPPDREDGKSGQRRRALE